MGKGKKSRKQPMVSVDEDDLAGLDDVTSDGEDDIYETDLTDNDTASAGAASVKKPYRKRARVDVPEELPLMEGEGKNFRVLGFNQIQRTMFVQLLMRFGTGKYDWAEFVPRLKKTRDEIKPYAKLFLKHLCEEMNDSLTFSDGVPKEGLQTEDVLVRIATLSLFRDKVKTLSKDSVLFTDDVLARVPGLKEGRSWKERHDRLLLQAVMKHGYGRWQQIVDDKALRIQEVICQELNLPFVIAPAPGSSRAHTSTPGTSQAQSNPVGPSAMQGSGSAASQTLGSIQEFLCKTRSILNMLKPLEVKQAAGDTVHGATATAPRAQPFQDQSMLYQFKKVKRRQVEFVKKRVLLLEKALNTEMQKQFLAEESASDTPQSEAGPDAEAVKNPSSEASNSQKIDQLPQVETIASEEALAVARDKDSDRMDMSKLYNEVSMIVETGNESLDLCKNLGALEVLNQEINQKLEKVSKGDDEPMNTEAEDNNDGLLLQI